MGGVQVSSSNQRYRSTSGGRVSVRATGRVYSTLGAAVSLASLSSSSQDAIAKVKKEVDEVCSWAFSPVYL